MPVRPVLVTERAFSDFIRDTKGELEKLKRGDYLRGRLSLEEVQVGNLLISVEEGGAGTPDGIVVSFTNVVTGSTAVMAVLP
jgi:hypothetical protein